MEITKRDEDGIEEEVKEWKNEKEERRRQVKKKGMKIEQRKN